MNDDSTLTRWRTLREMRAEMERNTALAAWIRAKIAARDVSLSDQSEAATRDVRGLVDRAGVAGFAIGELEFDQVPEWIGAGALAVLERWQQSRARLCSHKPQATRPQPVIAAAWRPNFIACLRCARRTAPKAGSIEHYTCDGCGVVSAEMVTGRCITLGPLLYEVGVCQTCASDERMPT